MSVLFVLVGFSLLVAGGFLIAFLWASRHGQFDDTYTPAVRILFDDASDKDNKNLSIESENKDER